ncbi:unnamed protein product [Penicillium olsonii]|uniref:N-acetyltransferase domain-containing protein n=1 Tax=Penicillium olsonii TaxID=99116 RepID=A0A9W4IE86_PENOL|nr:unnamed protein product [Penicillium olsonii]CAG8286748.1 unnamed protein product [Penicillium olsonii]
MPTSVCVWLTRQGSAGSQKLTASNHVHTALCSSTALLVPYSSWHVPRYHEWMKDPVSHSRSPGGGTGVPKPASQDESLTRLQEIQEATASEPLSIEEEYSMQRSWRQDADKLTFIVCRAITTGDEDDIPSQRKLQAESDSPSNMVGDINLFLRIDDGDDGDSPPQIVGEVELMIAEKVNQRRGFGRAALLMFLRYIVERQGSILDEFVGSGDVDVETVRKLRTGVEASGSSEGLELECLSVKIGHTNSKSLALFESTGFEKCSEEPNFFGEFELRRKDLSLGSVDGALEKAGVKGFIALPYERTE